MAENSADVQPLWSAMDLPDWANDLISIAVSGGKWPDGSENWLFDLSDAYSQLSEQLNTAVHDHTGAANTLLEAWEGPAAETFRELAQQLLWTNNSGLPGLAEAAAAYSQQTLAFGTETQYGKYTINIAFVIALIELFIAVLMAFFTCGASTAAVGAAKLILEEGIKEALQKLLTAAARKFAVKEITKVALKDAVKVVVKDAAKNAAEKMTVKEIMKEMATEAAEELVQDGLAQVMQMNQQTAGGQDIRKNFDWRQSAAAGLGGAIGGGLGIPLSKALSKPAFRGKVIGNMVTAMISNGISSPVASLIANAIVYGKVNGINVEDFLYAALSGGARSFGHSAFDPTSYSEVGKAIQEAHGNSSSVSTAPSAGSQGAPDTGTQSAPQTGSETGDQSASGTEGGNQESNSSSATGNQPQSGSQNASGNQSETGNQAASGGQPQTGDQGTSGNQDSGNQDSGSQESGSQESGSQGAGTADNQGHPGSRGTAQEGLSDQAASTDQGAAQDASQTAQPGDPQAADARPDESRPADAQQAQAQPTTSEPTTSQPTTADPTATQATSDQATSDQQATTPQQPGAEASGDAATQSPDNSQQSVAASDQTVTDPAGPAQRSATAPTSTDTNININIDPNSNAPAGPDETTLQGPTAAAPVATGTQNAGPATTSQPQTSAPIGQRGTASTSSSSSDRTTTRATDPGSVQNEDPDSEPSDATDDQTRAAPDGAAGPDVVTQAPDVDRTDTPPDADDIAADPGPPGTPSVAAPAPAARPAPAAQQADQNRTDVDDTDQHEQDHIDDAFTGGDIRPRALGEDWNWAGDVYAAARASTTDVAAIVNNTSDIVRPDGKIGFTTEEIDQIKQHLMVNEHTIVDRYTGEAETKRFDADPDIAEAWIRLVTGRFREVVTDNSTTSDAPVHQHPDITLLLHELSESTMMSDNPDLTYNDAHDAAQRTYPWASQRPDTTHTERISDLRGEHGTTDVRTQDRGDSTDGGVSVRNTGGRAGIQGNDRQGNQIGDTGTTDVDAGRGEDSRLAALSNEEAEQHGVAGARDHSLLDTTEDSADRAPDPLDAVNDPNELTTHGTVVAPEVQNLNNAVRQATRELSSSQFDPNDLRPRARKPSATRMRALLKHGVDAMGPETTDTILDTFLDGSKTTLSKTQLVSFAHNLQQTLPTSQRVTISPRTTTIVDLKSQLTTQLQGLAPAVRSDAAKLLIDTVPVTPLNRIRNLQLEVFLQRAVDLANNDAAELGLEGPGNWAVAPREKGMRVAPSTFQQQITGAMGGIVYQVTRVVVDANGAERVVTRNFDGLRHGMLVDAKANYFRVFDPGYTTPGDPDYTDSSDWARENNRRNLWQEFRGGRTAAENILAEANAQLQDADGHPIVWVTQHEHQAQIFQQLFLDHGIDITVRHEPLANPGSPPPESPDLLGPAAPMPSGPPPATSGTAAEVPDSEFHGDSRVLPNPDAVARQISKEMTSVSADDEPPAMAVYAGVLGIDHVDGTTYEVTNTDGSVFQVDIRPGSTPTTVSGGRPVAAFDQTRTEHSEGAEPDVTVYNVTVSDTAASGVIGRALAHEIGEIAQIEKGNTRRENLLTDRTVPSRPLTTNDLSAHDHGRIAELRYLEQSLVDSLGPRRTHLANELSALLTHLGLDASVDGPRTRHVTDGEVSPFARRLAGIPRDLVPIVILGNIGPDASVLAQGHSSLRAYVARGLLTQGMSGVATGAARAIAGGFSTASIASGALTASARAAGGVAQGIGDARNAERQAAIDAIGQALAITSGGPMDEAAARLHDAALTARDRHTSKPPEAADDDVNRTDPVRVRRGALQAPDSTGNTASFAAQYGAAPATELTLSAMMDAAATSLAPGGASVFDAALGGAVGNTVGAVGAILGEKLIAARSRISGTTRSSAVAAIDTDRAKVIEDVLTTSATALDHALAERAREILRRTHDSGGRPSDAHRAPQVGPGPDLRTTLVDTVAAFRNRFGISADQEARITALVDRAEAARGDRRLGRLRTSVTPEETQLHQALAELDMLPHPAADTRIDSASDHDWAHRWFALQTPGLSDRLAELIELPDGVAPMTAHILKGTASTGFGAGVSVAGFNLLSHANPVEALIESLVSAVVVGPIAGVGDRLANVHAQNHAAELNPRRHRILPSDLAKFEPALRAMNATLLSEIASQDRLLASFGVTSAASPDSNDHTAESEFHSVLSETYGQQDPARPAEVASRRTFFSRVLSPGGLTTATASAAFTTPLGGATGLVGTVTNAVGDALINHDTERAKAAREHQLQVVLDDVRAAIQASTATQLKQSRGVDVELETAPVDPVMQDVDPHVIDIDTPPSRLWTSDLNGMRMTVDLDRLRVTITDPNLSAPHTPTAEPHESAPRATAPHVVDAVRRARAASDEITRSVRDHLESVVRSSADTKAAETLREAESAASAARQSAGHAEQLPADDPAALQAVHRSLAATSDFYRYAAMALRHAHRANVDARAAQVASGGQAATPINVEADRMIEHAAYDAHLQQQHERYAAAAAEVDPGGEHDPVDDRTGHSADPPTERNATGTAVEISTRAARRLGIMAHADNDGHVILDSPRGDSIELTFREHPSDSPEALEVTRDGRRITITINTNAAMLNVALDIVGGITAIVEDGRGAPRAARLLRPDNVPTPAVPLTIADHQAIAHLRELEFLLAAADARNRPEIAARLEQQIDDLGLRAGTPNAAERRALLPDDLQSRLAPHPSPIDLRDADVNFPDYS